MATEYQPITIDMARLTRFEVIDHTPNGAGRAYVKTDYYPIAVELSFQDEGRTLKVFLKSQ